MEIALFFTILGIVMGIMYTPLLRKYTAWDDFQQLKNYYKGNRIKK